MEEDADSEHERTAQDEMNGDTDDDNSRSASITLPVLSSSADSEHYASFMTFQAMSVVPTGPKQLYMTAGSSSQSLDLCTHELLFGIISLIERGREQKSVPKHLPPHKPQQQHLHHHPNPTIHSISFRIFCNRLLKSAAEK